MISFLKALVGTAVLFAAVMGSFGFWVCFGELVNQLLHISGYHTGDLPCLLGAMAGMGNAFVSLAGVGTLLQENGWW